MKTILFIHHVSAIGGGSYCLLNILKAVDRTNILPIALLGEEGPLKGEIESLGIDVYVLKGLTCVPYNKSLFRRGSIHKLLTIKRSHSIFDEFLKNHPVDVVYFNNVMLYHYLKIVKDNSIKTVIHIREHWPESEHRWQLERLRKYVREYADSVVAINTYSANLVPGLKHKPTIIYDWIDFSDRYEERPFDTIFHEDCSDKKVFLFTGGYMEIKGALEVVDSFTRIVTDKNARLLILGTKQPEKYKGVIGKVKQVLVKLGYKTYTSKVHDLIMRDKRIVCINPTYKIKHIYQQAYCMLSFFTIPHANLALAECILLGTPCITAQTEESEEYSCNGTLAHMVQFGSIDELQISLSDNDNIVTTLRENLRNSSNEISLMFDKERNISILKNFLHSL